MPSNAGILKKLDAGSRGCVVIEKNVIPNACEES